MGIYEENTRVAPPPAHERVPDKAQMFADNLKRMSKEIPVDRSDYDIMLMAVSRRTGPSWNRCTHKKWVQTERARVASCWDLYTVKKKK
jgi:hypothetical protein